MTAPRKRRVFPFTAVIGQEEMKLALLLNVIDPRIGGVMIMGDRGTGKSTTIRALADLLPDIDVVAGDPYNSSASDPDLQSSEVRERMQQGETLSTEPRQVPMVDLPLGATEDRLCGTIDIEKALSEGVRAFEPGLLAKANRGLLYVDEVNIYIKQTAVGLCEQTGLKGSYALAQGFLDVDGAAEAVFCCTEGEIHHRYLPWFGAQGFPLFHPLAYLTALEVGIASRAVVGIASDNVDVRQQISQGTDRGGFAGATVSHDHHAADARINHVEKQGQLHLLLTDHRSEGEDPALPGCSHEQFSRRAQDCFTGCTVMTCGGVASAG